MVYQITCVYVNYLAKGGSSDQRLATGLEILPQQRNVMIRQESMCFFTFSDFSQMW